MDESLKAIEYIRDVAEYITTADGKITASALMEQFLFDGTQQWTRIEKLSGGEKRRLYLLHILMVAPNILILDEPTNDLDIQTLTILEDYLDTFQGIVISVSHDRYFLDRTAQRIFAFEDNGRIRQYEGGYSDYLAAVEERQTRENSAAGNQGKTKGAGDRDKDGSLRKGRTEKPREAKLRFTYKEQQEFNCIDEEIEQLEQKIAGLEQEMAEAATQYTKLNELMKEKEETEKQLEYKMERWVYLNDLAEQIAAQENSKK